VVQEIVREHGGEIEVESDAGIGTEFKIRLPVADQTYAQ
jgi:signal transduction histidine kinase